MTNNDGIALLSYDENNSNLNLRIFLPGKSCDGIID